MRVYRVLNRNGSPCGEIRFSPDGPEVAVAGPSGEAWMTLIREKVEGCRDRERLEEALRLAARGLPVRIEGLPPEPPPPPPDPALLERLRSALARRPPPDGLDRALLDAPDPCRLLDALFDAGTSGPEPLRRWIDGLERDFREPGTPSALENFARRWLRFRVEKPRRVH